jgi:HEAT repeat protein
LKSESDLKTRFLAVQALATMSRGGRAGARAAVPPLVVALSDADNELRLEAVAALERIGPDAAAAVPALVRMVDNKLPTVRRAAAAALVQIDPAGEHAAAAVLAAVRQADPNARRLLARHLRDADRADLARRLKGLAADDPDAAVRDEARVAAKEIAVDCR